MRPSEGDEIEVTVRGTVTETFAERACVLVNDGLYNHLIFPNSAKSPIRIIASARKNWPPLDGDVWYSTISEYHYFVTDGGDKIIDTDGDECDEEEFDSYSGLVLKFRIGFAV